MVGVCVNPNELGLRLSFASGKRVGRHASTLRKQLNIRKPLFGKQIGEEGKMIK